MIDVRVSQEEAKKVSDIDFLKFISAAIIGSILLSKDKQVLDNVKHLVDEVNKRFNSNIDYGEVLRILNAMIKSKEFPKSISVFSEDASFVITFLIEALPKKLKEKLLDGGKNND